jgi:hypothetical protein
VAEGTPDGNGPDTPILLVKPHQPRPEEEWTSKKRHVPGCDKIDEGRQGINEEIGAISDRIRAYILEVLRVKTIRIPRQNLQGKRKLP